MGRYVIEEEEDPSGFIIFIEIILCIIFLPIGIIVLIIKASNYFSEKKRLKKIQNSELKHINDSLRANKYSELEKLATLRDKGVISAEEFWIRKERIMREI